MRCLADWLMVLSPRCDFLVVLGGPWCVFVCLGVLLVDSWDFSDSMAQG